MNAARSTLSNWQMGIGQHVHTRVSFNNLYHICAETNITAAVNTLAEVARGGSRTTSTPLVRPKKLLFLGTSLVKHAKGAAGPQRRALFAPSRLMFWNPLRRATSCPLGAVQDHIASHTQLQPFLCLSLCCAPFSDPHTSYKLYTPCTLGCDAMRYYEAQVCTCTHCSL